MPAKKKGKDPAASQKGDATRKKSAAKPSGTTTRKPPTANELATSAAAERAARADRMTVPAGRDFGDLRSSISEGDPDDEYTEASDRAQAAKPRDGIL
jgi:hypothetical protein